MISDTPMITNYQDWMFNPSKQVTVIYDTNNKEVIVSSVYDILTGKKMHRSREMFDALIVVRDSGELSQPLHQLIDKLITEIQDSQKYV